MEIDRFCAGVDEVGRGPIAGPVVAAAVILDPARDWSALRDSKRLTAVRREQLAVQIRTEAIGFAIAEVDVESIDRLNIRQAALLAMSKAVEALEPAPRFALVDGRDLPTLPCPGEAIVGGDGSVAAISAASIIAKVHRDAGMHELHARYPDYGFDQHMGYPTALHRQRLESLGPCPAHRRSFAPVRAVLSVGAPPLFDPHP